MALIANAPLDTPAIVMSFQDNVLKRARKRPFLDTKSAIERARRLKTARNVFVVMRVCSPVVLSYLDAGFEPQCGRKDFFTACCCCLLLLLAAAEMCRSSLDPKKGCKTSTG